MNSVAVHGVDVNSFPNKTGLRSVLGTFYFHSLNRNRNTELRWPCPFQKHFKAYRLTNVLKKYHNIHMWSNVGICVGKFWLAIDALILHLRSIPEINEGNWPECGLIFNALLSAWTRTYALRSTYQCSASGGQIHVLEMRTRPVSYTLLPVHWINKCVQICHTKI